MYAICIHTVYFFLHSILYIMYASIYLAAVEGHFCQQLSPQVLSSCSVRPKKNRSSRGSVFFSALHTVQHQQADPKNSRSKAVFQSCFIWTNWIPNKNWMFGSWTLVSLGLVVSRVCQDSSAESDPPRRSSKTASVRKPPETADTAEVWEREEPGDGVRSRNLLGGCLWTLMWFPQPRSQWAPTTAPRFVWKVLAHFVMTRRFSFFVFVALTSWAFAIRPERMFLGCALLFSCFTNFCFTSVSFIWHIYDIWHMFLMCFNFCHICFTRVSRLFHIGFTWVSLRKISSVPFRSLTAFVIHLLSLRLESQVEIAKPPCRTEPREASMFEKPLKHRKGDEPQNNSMRFPVLFQIYLTFVSRSFDIFHIVSHVFQVCFACVSHWFHIGFTWGSHMFHWEIFLLCSLSIFDCIRNSSSFTKAEKLGWNCEATVPNWAQRSFNVWKTIETSKRRWTSK